MNIYIAGPIKEKELIQEMIEVVKKRYPDANLYIPMDYKVPGDFQKLDGTWNLPNHEWAKKVFESDINHLKNSDLIFSLYTGYYHTSGTIWEIGYACGLNIPVIAYIPYFVKDVSLMVMNSFSNYITNDGVINSITDEFLSKFNQK